MNQVHRRLAAMLLAMFCQLPLLVAIASEPTAQRRLYVASPGVRDYLHWGGHGVLVFDIDQGHQFLRRISLAGQGLDDAGRVLNIKGICAHAASRRLYVTTLQHLIAIDLVTERVVWQKAFDLGCDRPSISPDGETVYVPSLEHDVWYVVKADSGDEIKRLEPRSKSHNTVFSLDGKEVYLAGLGSPMLSVADARTHSILREIGPFSASVRPFTVNGSSTLVFANVNGLLGFEVGDLRNNRPVQRMAVEGAKLGMPKRHGCPSHGIGLTPDERELWLCDGFNQRLHVFDATRSPPAQTTSIALREQPGWITFSLDGRYGYPSTGEVIDVASHRVVATLADEMGREVHSEKLLEIDWRDDLPSANADQFGVGRVAARQPAEQ